MAEEPLENISLYTLNTLQICAVARYYLDIHSVSDLRFALSWARRHDVSILVLGGGSNLVFRGDFEGLVVRMRIRNRLWEDVNNQDATLVLGAGENWHESVLYAANSGYRGIENLALIPGTAGAAPVQNIGAYGVELCDTLVSVTALDRNSSELVELTRDDCQFAYRDSLFKRSPGRYVVLEIRLRLSRTSAMQLKYRDLQEYLANMPGNELGPAEIAQAVMAIRRRKLPDPVIIPNVGSFFKNPVISEDQFTTLQASHPDIVSYHQSQGVKLAAAWLIDQCGWKGFRNRRVGVHNRQALVLINHSEGTGKDILELAGQIMESVKTRFGVELEMEPGIVG
jgi:UDP-N-acetylmuramate dehydrogenase